MKKHRHIAFSLSEREILKSFTEYPVEPLLTIALQSCVGGGCMTHQLNRHESAEKAQRTEWLLEKKLDTQAQRLFRIARHKMPPSITSILIWYRQCKGTGSVLYKESTGYPCLTVENFERTCHVFIRSPRKSTGAVNCASDFVSTDHSVHCVFF
jgi:hypothetical protein